jgi:hypothetical protein
MAFAARDYFETKRPPPADTTAPGSGTLYDYLVRRLLESFGLPLGPAKYLELMNPVLPDGESFLSRLGWLPHGRAWRMVKEEWPKVRGDLDAGRLSPLGLVKVKSADPRDLGENHQVLAYGYDLTGDRVTIRIYDPNHPNRDDVSLALSIGDPNRPIGITAMPATTVYMFFRVTYVRQTPP